MSSRGAGEIAAKLRMLEVACSRCERHGRLSLAKLLHYPVLSDRLQFPCFGFARREAFLVLDCLKEPRP